MRAAAWVALLLAIGHTAGHPWMPAEDPASLAVAAAMRSEHFNVMGLQRSYFDFYVGFGWLLSVYSFGHALLYWLLAPVAAPAPPKLAAIVGVLVIESIIILWVSWKYLFWVPVDHASSHRAAVGDRVRALAAR